MTTEQQIINKLVQKLEDEEKWMVEKNINFGKMAKARLVKMKVSGEHPLQPQIDILCYDTAKDCLHAIEVKYYRYTGLKDSNYAKILAVMFEKGYIDGEYLNQHISNILQTTPRTYYAGIDESLALLNYGVDYAWLYHVIEIPPKWINWTEWVKNIIDSTPVGYKTLMYTDEKFTKDTIMKNADPNPILGSSSPESEKLEKIRKALIENLF